MNTIHFFSLNLKLSEALNKDHLNKGDNIYGKNIPKCNKNIRAEY